MRRIACIAFLAVFVTAGAVAQDATETLDLGEAVITGVPWAPSALSPAAATVILDADDIASSGASHLGELMETVPGMVVRSYGYAGSARTASVRGGAGGHVVVVVDGVRLNDARTGSVDLSSVPLSGVERVEVLRSGSSALYGSDAIAGVVYVKSARTGDPALSFDASTTMYPIANTAGLDAWLAAEALSMAGRTRLGSVTLSAAAGLDRAAEAQAVADEDAGYLMRDNAGLLAVHGTVGAVIPASVGIITASAFGRYADKGVPGSLDYPSSVASQTEYEARGATSWGTDALFGGAASLDVLVSGAWSRLEYVNPDYAQDDAHDTLGADLGIRSGVLIGPALVKIGVEAGADGATSTKIGEQSRLFGGVYAIPEMELGDIIIVPSFRFDAYSDFDAGISYGLGVSWKKGARDGALSLGISGASAYKAPALNDLYWPEDLWTKGNPDLAAERSWGTELNLQYAGNMEGISFTVEASPYARYVDDMISWLDPDGWMGPEPSSPVNIDTAIYTGADMSVSADIGAASLKGAYSYTLAKDIAGGVAFEDAPRLALVPLHTISAEVGVRVGSATATVDASFNAGRLDSSGEEMPDILLVGVGAGWEVLAGTVVGLSADNLLDTAYVENTGYPMPGMAVTLSVRFSN